jgi:hypothetical protein
LHRNWTGFGNNGELARSEGMTHHRDENGNFDVSDALYTYVGMDDEKIIDYDEVQRLFLTPQFVQWDVLCQPTLPRCVIAVGLGHYHMLVAARDGRSPESQVYASGLNRDGQLGLGHYNPCHALTHVRM